MAQMLEAVGEFVWVPHRSSLIQGGIWDITEDCPGLREGERVTVLFFYRADTHPSQLRCQLTHMKILRSGDQSLVSVEFTLETEESKASGGWATDLVARAVGVPEAELHELIVELAHQV